VREIFCLDRNAGSRASALRSSNPVQLVRSPIPG